MGQADLHCALEITPAAGGDIALAFRLRNRGSHPVEIHFFRPFLSFELAVEADDGPVPVIQPAYNVRVQPQTATIPPGDTLEIATPIRLRFDPDVPPSGGDVPTRWSLRHEPAPIRLRATLQLSGVSVAPCQAHFDPQSS